MADSHSFDSSLRQEEGSEKTKRLDIFQKKDQPCDVTLVVKDGKQFRAHENVLSKASSFFEKMLDNNWKESREGVIRLDVLSGDTTEVILEFVYSGTVTDVGTLEKAEELIVAADYLFLPGLQDVARRFFKQSISTSNAVSIYNIAKRLELYNCQELLAYTKNFILSNFTSVANEEEFLNLPSHEFEYWISSDDIRVSKEDDVFNIILKWIYHDEDGRKHKFQDLFRHVRLTFLTRNCLVNEVEKNDLVKRNSICQRIVKLTLKWVSSPQPPVCTGSISGLQSPRRVLQTEVLVACVQSQVLFYLPDEDEWYRLPNRHPFFTKERNRDAARWLLSCKNNLFFLDGLLRWVHSDDPSKRTRYEYDGLCYDPFFNQWMNWTELPCINDVIAVTVVKEEIYAVQKFWKRMGYARRPSDCLKHCLVKYNQDSNSWNYDRSFDWGQKIDVCVVSADKYLYAIGGRSYPDTQTCLAETSRFDTVENKWESLANIQEARYSAFGAAVNEKIFIAGGRGTDSERLQTCEMYNVSTNEWQFIANLTPSPKTGSLVCLNGTLYLFSVGRYVHGPSRRHPFPVTECYDPEKNKWKKTAVLLRQSFWPREVQSVCSLKIFKGALNSLDLEVWPPEHQRKWYRDLFQ